MAPSASVNVQYTVYMYADATPGIKSIFLNEMSGYCPGCIVITFFGIRGLQDATLRYYFHLFIYSLEPLPTLTIHTISVTLLATTINGKRKTILGPLITRLLLLPILECITLV